MRSEGFCKRSTASPLYWKHSLNELMCCALIPLGDQHGYRNREVVQSNEGLWIHSAARWRQSVFVHISAVERAGLSSLNEGQVVQYEIESSRGKESAINLKVK